MKKFVGFVFLIFSLTGFLSAQTINIDRQSQEFMWWKDNTYSIDHLYVNTYPNEYTDREIIREICNFLQRNNLIGDVNLNNISTISIEQFNADLKLKGYSGAHPIFEWWNTSCDWHTIQYKKGLYIIKGDYGSLIFKLNV
jgi:hypothetical protein